MNSSATVENGTLTAPSAHELEIVFFGPGTGECVLLHLGEAEWFVIDSCIYPGKRMAAAIEYFEKISVEPSTSVKRVLATHWHDDHVRGLANLLRRCPDARFAMSGALAADQFYQLVLEVNARNKLVSATSTASEFADILDLLAERGSSIATPDFYAQDSMVLFSGGYKGCAKVHALSPSAATITSANVALAEKILTKEPMRCFKKLGPNDLSVVTHVNVANVSLLLGADLENTADASLGWTAVVHSPSRPPSRASLFKIAHHGSENADCQDIWQLLLEPNPLSIVTPFSRQREALPKDSDVNRLRGKTDRLYATTWPPSIKPPRRRGVDGIVAGATRRRTAANRRPGFVRVRFDLQEQSPKPVVHVFGSGRRL